MTKIFIFSASFFAFIGVLTRSLSSHPIRQFLMDRGKLENFNIGADYLLFHGLALLAIAILCHLFPDVKFHWAGWLFIAGSLLFQGSVLIKSCISIAPFGFVTPVGGFLLMAGWVMVAVSALRIPAIQ